MELRIIILIGIAIQFLLFTTSRKRAAIFGYVITTFVLIYGLVAYNSSGRIALFYIEISQGLFIALCILWYGFDTYELINAIKTSFELNEELLKDNKVADYYKYTYSIWANGTLDSFNKGYKKETKLGYNHFIRNNGPHVGGAMEAILTKFDPLENEYFIGIGEKKTGIERGCFVLTNYRLFIKDGLTQEYLKIDLSNLNEFKHSEDVSKPCVIKLKSGETKEIHNVEIYPTQAALNFAMDQFNKLKK
jgi:hypothetical protein